MTVHTYIGDDFTALTVTDDRGATLNVERTDDGRLSAWIAPPGGNDGCSVRLDFPDAVSVASYLSADVRSWSLPAEPNVDRVRDRHNRLWVRARYTKSPDLWWQGEPGNGLPCLWMELLSDGPLTDASNEQVTA